MHDRQRSETEPTDRLVDPTELTDCDGVETTTETRHREGPDHCGTDIEGVVIVGTTDDAGELLVLIEEEEGIAILPHSTVEPGDDWAATAREGVEAQTGIEIELDDVELCRTVEHLVDEKQHAKTHRVLYGGSPTGGEIQACKQRAGDGSDGWRAAWVDDLPPGIETPEGGEGDDLDRFLG